MGGGGELQSAVPVKRCVNAECLRSPEVFCPKMAPASRDLGAKTKATLFILGEIRLPSPDNKRKKTLSSGINKHSGGLADRVSSVFWCQVSVQAEAPCDALASLPLKKKILMCHLVCNYLTRLRRKQISVLSDGLSTVGLNQWKVCQLK